jgi:hypothetical protein
LTSPDDEENVNSDDPEVALQVATSLKSIGTDLFKAGNHAQALEKYQSTSATLPWLSLT